MNRRRVLSCLSHVLVFSLLLSMLVPVMMGQANVQGQWSTLSYMMPINPVHVALLNNGKVLIVAGSGNCPPSQSGCPTGAPYGPANSSGAAVWDPVTGNITQLTLAWDMFCNGMVVLPDGRAFVNGGTLQYDPFHGEPRSAVFDPSTSTFTNVQSMAHGRWYPTVTVLGDGRVMTFSGLDENGATNKAVEFYTVGSGWSQQYLASWTPPLYPRMHLLPNGKVFYSGSGTSSALFDPSTQSWTTNVATTKYGGTRTYGTSVLLPLTPADNYDPKVLIMGGGSPATATAEIIDLGAPIPAWQFGPSMSQPRIEMNATILPNGKVLAMGGSVNDEDTATKSLNADLFGPDPNNPGKYIFSSANANTYARLYHSVSLLLPDATVWLAGGNPQRGSYEQHMEIYKPAYLFNPDGTLAVRPTITSAPASISYGNPFTVQTPDAATISSAVLVRPGSPTHAFDQDQRLVGVSFTAGNGALTVTAPPNGNIAPQGYYMLFILNASGVPSLAKMAQLGPPPSDTQPPTAPSNLTATAVGGSQINLSWTASTDNVGVTGYLVERCQGAGCNNFAQIGTAPGTTYNDTGLTANTSYSYRVRATDAAGNLSPYSNVASATTQATIPGLVAAYSFNEGVGTTVADSSGTGNTGTITNATWTTGGKYGNALVFNGTNALVNIPDAPSLHLTNGMTLEVWVNPSVVTSAWRDVIYKGNDNYYLEGTSDNGSRPAGGGTWSSGTPLYGTAALTVNTWAHLALTYDGANLRLYVNGTQVASQARTGNIATSTNPLQIGGDSLYGQYFPGSIDEVRVYNVALTAAQVQSDMNTPIGNFVDTQAPTVPTNLTATAVSGSQINLSWTASTDNVGVTGYLVERCTGTGCNNFAQIGTAPGTTYNDTGLTSGTSYSYRVRATDAAGNLSPYSNVASATTQAPDTQPPTAPSNLTATAISGSQINLSWTASTDNVGVTGYLVERCTGTGCNNFAQIGTAPGTTYNDTGLTSGTSYSYRVRATDAAGNLSPYSNVASATTQAPDTQPPTAPSNLTATAISGSQINLSWTASTDNVGVTGYLVERCQGAGCNNFAQIGTAPGTTYNDTGLTANTSYSYRVRATDAAGNLSSYSNVASATTAANTGLVAAYSFNEGTGTTVADSSGQGNTGTITNATWTTGGKYGNALVFNGTSARVTIPDAASLHLTNGMTLEVWVNPSVVTTAWRDVIYKGNDNYYLEGTSDNGSRPAGGGTWSSGTPLYGTAALTVNTWAHLALTYDGANLRLYVNGTQVASQARTGNIATSTNPLQIGGDSLYGQYFQGSIDEVRVYNVALTAAQVQSDMNTPIGNFVDTQPPTAPSNLTATAVSGSQINLSWTGSTDNVGVTGYLLERCTGAGCNNFAQIGTAPGTTYNDTGLTSGTSYSYRVRATDAAGNLSPYSNVASATTATSSALVAAYSFDEGAGTTVTDLSGNGNTGTIANATWTSTGKYGKAPVFNGTNSWVTIPDAPSLDLTTGETLEAWVYPFTIPPLGCSPAPNCPWMDVIHKDSDRYYIEASSNQNQEPEAGGIFASGKHIVFGPSILPINAWTHLALTYDSAFIRFYVNGTLVASSPETSPITTSTHPLFIGGDQTMGQFFNGLIDEVRIYNTALNQAQIQVDMNTPVGNPSSDIQPPTAPTNLTATAISGSQINLSWTASTDNVGVTGYLVERCTGAGCNNFAQIGTAPGTTYNDTGLTANTSYSYRVRATDAAGNLSPYSNVASATTAANTGLVAAYSFNEGVGTTVADSSGQGNTGTIANATWTTGGKYGNALVFNGTSARVTIPDAASLHLTNGMTLEVWVNPSVVTTAWRDVIYKGNDNYYLEGTSDNGSRPAGGGTWSSGTPLYGTAALTVNTWAHLALTYDGANLRLYVNGTQVASQARTGNIATSTNPLQIGGDSLYGQYFQGSIDEVRVYNVALTAAQVQSDMSAPIP